MSSSKNKQYQLWPERTSTGELPQLRVITKSYIESYSTHPGIDINYNAIPSEENLGYALAWAHLDYDKYVDNEILAELSVPSLPLNSMPNPKVTIRIKEYDSHIYLFDVCFGIDNKVIWFEQCETYKQAISLGISLLKFMIV